MPLTWRRAAGPCLMVACAAAVGCASQGMPPGGPPDLAPPVLLKVSPESGAVDVSPKSVTFRFNEVVSERPQRVPSLDQLVLISPTDGAPSVDWGRDAIIVRPRHGWRPNTAYSVTVLPGLADLRGNAAKEAFRTVFATGATIPTGAIRGATFDLMAGKQASGTRIEATIGTDTVLRYAAAADSLGRFSLGTLPAATFLIRAWIDANNNGIRDPRESWDSTTVTLPDSSRHDLYLFAHDTIGARLAEVTITDSMTIRVRFDHGLRTPLTVENIRLTRRRDSTEVPIVAVLAAGGADSAAIKAKAAREDSIARADTSAKGRAALARADSLKRARAADSTAKAQTDAVRAARDTVRREQPPKFERTVPPTEFVVQTRDPITFADTLRLTARNVQALSGPARTSDRIIQRPRPPAAPRDSTATKRPPPRDTLRGLKPTREFR